MRRVITLAILIIVNFCLQTTLFGFHNLNSITPNLMLILTMSFGLMRGRKEGLLVGFFCGFLTDVFFSNILGPFMLLYMFIGYINGYFHRKYIVEDVLLPIIVILADDFAFNFIIYIFYFLLNNRIGFFSYFYRIIMPEMLVTTLLTIIIYKLYVSINRHLKKKEEGVSEK